MYETSLFIVLVFALLAIFAWLSPKEFQNVITSLLEWVSNKKQTQQAQTIQQRNEYYRPQIAHIVFEAFRVNAKNLPFLLRLPNSVEAVASKIIFTQNADGYNVWRLQLLHLTPNDGKLTTENIKLCENILFEYFRHDTFSGFSIYSVFSANEQGEALNFDFISLPSQAAVSQYLQYWQNFKSKDPQPKIVHTPFDEEFH